MYRMLFSTKFSRYTDEQLIGDTNFNISTFPINMIARSLQVEITQLYDAIQVINPKNSTLEVTESVKQFLM